MGEAIKTLYAGLMAVTLLLAVVIIPSSPLAAADDQNCTGPLGPGIFDNIVVPSGDCLLAPYTIVMGNVKIIGGGFSANKVFIGGSLQADEGTYVLLLRSTVGGDVQIKKTTGWTQVDSSAIGGNVQIEEKPSGQIIVGFNSISGNLKEEKNTVDLNLVKGNNIGGNLQCKENNVAPSNLGIDNITVGNEEDQCAGL